MAWKLTLDDINEYKAAFSLFDKDEDGKISSDEMGILMRSLGQNFSNKEFKKITEEIDSQSDGNVELHEFLNLMAENRQLDEDRTELIKAFKYFDRENKGTIELEEIKHVLTTVSEKLNQEEIQEFIKLSQIDSSNQINYKDLVKYILLK